MQIEKPWRRNSGGATDNVAERGDEAVKKIMELNHADGADAVLECVGTEQ